MTSGLKRRSPVAIWRVARALAVATALFITANECTAAWHDDHSGSGIAVHYVRLTGYGGDNDVNRRNLVLTQRACVDNHARSGKPFVSVPPSAIPAIVQVHEVEIYYAAQRTVTIQHMTLNDIDFDTCGLLAIVNRVMKITSVAGKCDIDLIRNVALGMCGGSLSIPGWPSVLPRRIPASPVGSEYRTIAGTTCRVRVSAMLANWQTCLATAESNPAQQFDPYPVAIAPLNGGEPGLLLETRTPVLTLQAQEVRLNLSVAPALFEIPAGARINPGEGARP